MRAEFEPVSISAMTSEDVVRDVRETLPVPHLTDRHISDDSNSTAESCAAELPEAFCVDVVRVCQSDMPVIRVYLLPASHPAASFRVDNAMHTRVFDELVWTTNVERSATMDRTPGSVIAYLPETFADAAISLDGRQIVAFNAPNTTHATASRPNTGATMPRMILA